MIVNWERVDQLHEELDKNLADRRKLFEELRSARIDSNDKRHESLRTYREKLHREKEIHEELDKEFSET